MLPPAVHLLHLPSVHNVMHAPRSLFPARAPLAPETLPSQRAGDRCSLRPTRAENPAAPACWPWLLCAQSGQRSRAALDALQKQLTFPRITRFSGDQLALALHYFSMVRAAALRFLSMVKGGPFGSWTAALLDLFPEMACWLPRWRRHPSVLSMDSAVQRGEIQSNGALLAALVDLGALGSGLNHKPTARLPCSRNALRLQALQPMRVPSCAFCQQCAFRQQCVHFANNVCILPTVCAFCQQ